MKVLVIHNAYRQSSGEDVVVRREVDLLRSAGHDIVFHEFSNDTISGFPASLKAFANAPYSAASGHWMRETLRNEGPDIVHIHNFFPLLSPSIHEAAAGAGLAVVQTLHNYRTICAGATLLRAGQPCQKCVGGQRLWGALHRCYRQSLPASVAAVAMQVRADRSRSWHRHVHRFIALSDHGKALFEQGGLPADRLVVKPHFAPELPAGVNEERCGALFVGRLSPEKGLATLLEAAGSLPTIPLTVVGDGPLRATLAAGAPPQVSFTGALPPDQVSTRMRRAQLLVVPSIAPEPFGLVVVEAFSHRLPVLAARTGALPSLVQPGYNGALFRPGNVGDLRDQLQFLLSAPDRLQALGRNAHQSYENFYTPARNLHLLETIYRDALALARNRPSA